LQPGHAPPSSRACHGASRRRRQPPPGRMAGPQNQSALTPPAARPQWLGVFNAG
jgi:hypothetical protein